jgi:N-acetylglucosamine kinase-like BadF-type ATPase
MSSDYVLAVDAGNTKSVVLVADREGTVLGRVATGAGDIYGADRPEQAIAVVLRAVEDALADAGVRAGDVAAATCCLAGVDWPEDNELWTATMRGLFPSARLEVRNDGFALLWCLNPEGVGVAVTVGTGPAIAARAPGGDTSYLGFWCQQPLGGVGLAELGLRAVYLAELGLGEPTALRPALLEWAGLDDVEAMLHSFTGREARGGWGRAASAARIVLACAQGGDEVSAALVSDQARALVDYARAVATRAGIDLVAGRPRESTPAGAGVGERWQLALGGGIVTAEIPVFREALQHEVAARLPGAEPVVVTSQPAVGALVGALGLISADTARDAFPRLVETSRLSSGGLR